jgi:uncharacterized protein YkwD
MMGRILGRVLVLALALAAAAHPSLAAQKGPAPRQVVEASKAGRLPLKGIDLGSLEYVIVAKINDERGSQGLPPLSVSPELARLARQYSRDMAERRYFAHVDPEGKRVGARVEESCGIVWSDVGENIARNRGFADPAEVAVREWMKSRGHRENILSAKYRETGVGVWTAPDGTVYCTQIFLTRKPEPRASGR